MGDYGAAQFRDKGTLYEFGLMFRCWCDGRAASSPTPVPSNSAVAKTWRPPDWRPRECLYRHSAGAQRRPSRVDDHRTRLSPTPRCSRAPRSPRGEVNNRITNDGLAGNTAEVFSSRSDACSLGSGNIPLGNFPIFFAPEGDSSIVSVSLVNGSPSFQSDNSSSNNNLRFKRTWTPPL